MGRVVRGAIVVIFAVLVVVENGEKILPFFSPLNQLGSFVLDAHPPLASVALATRRGLAPATWAAEAVPAQK